MKKLLFILFLCSIANFIFAQKATYNLTGVKEKVASGLGLSTKYIKTLTVREFGSRTWVIATFDTGDQHGTFGQEWNFGGPGGGLPISGSITCSGNGCSECDIMGLPNIQDAYCSCVRQSNEGGHCNMSKTIGF